MAPVVTVTKVLKKQKLLYDKHSIKEHDTKDTLLENCDSKSVAAHRAVDYYDEALPKNDPKFLAPVRRWEKRMGFLTPLRWINIIVISLFHIITVASTAYIFIMGEGPKWQTNLFELTLGGVSGFGVTAGAHRYWTHRAFKATTPLRIIFMLCFSLSGQNNIFNWVRDHRVHHKRSETIADPHDARRGFFFAHVGWLLMKKHPLVVKEGNQLDMSDIINDPVVKFHTKYFNFFKITLCLILPSITKVLLWNETWKAAIVSTLVRYLSSVNFTWSVNSFAHLWGNRPYDKHIMPVESWKVSFFAMGEGWHNYHHTFPWDYKAAELSYFLNVTTMYIDLFAALGWAYDLKKASPSLIEAIVKKRGYKS
ncbi:acyl-CoA Delta(11) desaturase-like isoform X2 [Pararge aegeria]|uniref:Jg17434 protein n=3 Tax=Pararge aegeria TaxID=116150 RepID=A0A8S4S4R9_9NEOP|nr:acyl-CoA Delta(11) desaturase-like isoform X2 [Pararge aegeria]CAH2245037.1 jg17434 [Pararge aegeria aegeria]